MGLKGNSSFLRKTGYKIFERNKSCGIEGLTDRRVRPYRQANRLPFQIETLIVRLMGREDGTWPLGGACGDLSERTRMSRCRKADQIAEHRCT